MILEVEHFDEYLDIITTECQQSMPIYCAEDEVAKGAQKMAGCDGPTGVDGLMLRGWVLLKGQPSEKIRKEITRWVLLLSNESPTYALCRALDAS